MATIAQNLQDVRARIAAAARAAGRDPRTVRLVAVSKTFEADSVRAAALAGQEVFGENYVQEGVSKIQALADLKLEWHFIGPLQSNKTRAVAEFFDWVHGVDRIKIAQRLSAAREGLPPLQVCIQVNTSSEASKSGIEPTEVLALAREVARLPNLVLRGLMTIPEPSPDQGVVRRRYRLLRELLDTANSTGLRLDTLSMGMSQDIELAVEEGATLVRVGTAIFGRRAKKLPSGA